jgi:proline dehydrogenase
MPIAATLRGLPERTLRNALLALSRRRSLGRLATRLPVTRGMVDRFVAGETLDRAIPALERLRAAGLHSTVDELGESVSSRKAAVAAADAYIAALDTLADRDLDRNISLKLTQMGLDIDADLCRTNVERILRRAGEVEAFVRIDMEDHTKTDTTLALWRELRAVNATSGESGVVIQAALRRSAEDVERLIKEGARVRLCKGAYVEPAAVAYVTKPEVDRNYVALMEPLLREGHFPAIATHDPRILRRATDMAEREGITPDRFEFQMLFGIRRDLQERLVAEGFGVRVYVPYGRDWYPYFMRRLAERPANVAFLLRSILREGRRG